MAAGLARNLLVAFWVCLCTFVCCEDTLYITHSPSYVEFQKDAGPIDVNEVPQILSLALGFSSSQELKWGGLPVGDVFRRPKANILITIETVDNSFSLNAGNDLIEYQLHGKTDVNLRALQDAISSMYGDRSLNLELTPGIQGVHVSDSYRDTFKDLPDTLTSMLPRLRGDESVLSTARLGSLNGTSPADVALLSELQFLREIIKKLGDNPLAIKDNVPDLYSLDLAGLRVVQSRYGLGSNQALDAARLLADAVSQFSTEMVNLYDGDALVEVMTSHQEPLLNRQSRSLLQESATGAAPTVAPATPSPDKLPTIGNKAPFLDADFPVVFNIILWLGIVLVLAIYATAYALWTLDPGDTIIYRMTSQRMKID